MITPANNLNISWEGIDALPGLVISCQREFRGEFFLNILSGGDPYVDLDTFIKCIAGFHPIAKSFADGLPGFFEFFGPAAKQEITQHGRQVWGKYH